jgi:transposase-like protein
MASYSNEFKEKIVLRMLPPNNESLSKISKETGISFKTLTNWRKQVRVSGQAAPAGTKESERWSSQDKFLIVIETASMNEVELSKCCRQKGLYVEQVKEWDNNNHRHSGINFLTPNQRHAPDHGLNVLKKRELVYKSAKLKHLGR